MKWLDTETVGRREKGLRGKGLLLLMTLSMILGCFSADHSDLAPTANVEGVVTFRGKPLPPGSITFHPQGVPGNPASGLIEAGGRFRLSTYERYDGAVIGKHKVTVTVTPLLDGSVPDPPVTLPPQYGNVAKTPLEVEVIAGKTNQFQLDLTEGI